MRGMRIVADLSNLAIKLLDSEPGPTLFHFCQLIQTFRDCMKSLRTYPAGAKWLFNCQLAEKARIPSKFCM